MTQTLQSLRYPHLVLDEMLRIGDQAIITFPNFGHWRTRASLLFNGRMPVTKQLSYQWYDTPNIHFFTYKDFETLCVERKIKIVGRVFVGGYSSTLGMDRVWPNLFAQTAIYRLRK
jgi:methionine biosynthesis protein MetW